MSDKLYWSIDKLKGWDKNPRSIKKEDFERLKRQITKLGQYKPVLVTPEGEVLGGNMRLKAYKELGMKDIWVSIVEPKTEAEKIEYALSDNDRAGYYIQDQLYSLLEPQALNLNLDDYTIDLKEPLNLKRFLDNYKGIIEDDFDVEGALENIEEPKTKRGDIYQLGNHKLMCSDSSQAEEVGKLISGKEIDVLLTDPPYGIDIVKDNSKIGFGDGRLGFKSSIGSIGGGGIVNVGIHRKIIGDDKPFNPSHLLTYGKNQIIWGGNYFANKLKNTSCWIIWDKRENIPSNNFADAEIAWSSFEKPTRIYRQLWSGLLRKGNRKEEMNKRQHPTQKPVGIHGVILRDFTKENDIILDIYGGSGTTLIACEQLNRKCYMMELDERYCDVIISRWELFSGKKAVKLEDVR